MPHIFWNFWICAPFLVKFRECFIYGIFHFSSGVYNHTTLSAIFILGRTKSRSSCTESRPFGLDLVLIPWTKKLELSTYCTMLMSWRSQYEHVNSSPDCSWLSWSTSSLQHHISWLDLTTCVADWIIPRSDLTTFGSPPTFAPPHMFASSSSSFPSIDHLSFVLLCTPSNQFLPTTFLTTNKTNKYVCEVCEPRI